MIRRARPPPWRPWSTGSPARSPTAPSRSSWSAAGAERSGPVGGLSEGAGLGEGAGDMAAGAQGLAEVAQGLPARGEPDEVDGDVHRPLRVDLVPPVGGQVEDLAGLDPELQLARALETRVLPGLGMIGIDLADEGRRRAGGERVVLANPGFVT